MKEANEATRLGSRVRTLRLRRGMTIKQLAERASLTQSFISQFERNLVAPSVASLTRIAAALGVTITSLFADMPLGSVVRRHQRGKIVYPGLGMTDYIVTPDSSRKLQVIHSLIEPGGGSGDDPYSHDGDEECVVVLSGCMEITVASDTFVLGEGDSITFSSHTPHQWRNVGEKRLEVIWCITPPSY